MLLPPQLHLGSIIHTCGKPRRPFSTTPAPSIYATFPNSTNNHLFILWKIVLRNFQIQGCRPLPRSARNVVVRAVAGAEPASEVPGFTYGHAAEMCADACVNAVRSDAVAMGFPIPYLMGRGSGGGNRTEHYQPFGLLDAVRVRLGIP